MRELIKNEKEIMKEVMERENTSPWLELRLTS